MINASFRQYKRLAWYSIINIIVFVSVLMISARPSFSQDKPRVNIFEFKVLSSDEHDVALKGLIQQKIIDRLTSSKKIERVELVPNDILAMIGSKEEYIKEEKIRYVINGELESLSEDRIKIKIELKDRGINGTGSETIGWNRPVILRKDLSDIEFWFDRVSLYIFSIIEGSPISEVVFTDCFESYDSNDPTIRRLKLSLPIELKEILKKKGFDKDIVTFNDPREARFECGKYSREGRNIKIYDYVIFGVIKPDKEAGKIDVQLQVKITNENRDAFLKGFKDFKDSDQFVEHLADYIINQWSQTIEK